MPEARRQPVFDTWKVKSLPYHIVYSQAVVREIATTVVEQDPNAVGILLGSHEALEIRVTSYRRLQAVSSPAGGDEPDGEPDNHLEPDRDQDSGGEFNEAVQERMRALKQQVEEGAPAQSLEVVGWFRGRSGNRIFLSPRDARLHEDLFDKPWQVALVIRPTRGGGAKGGFFLREVSGELRTRASHKDFDIAGEEPAELLREDEQPQAPPGFHDFAAAGPRKRRWLGAIAALLVLAAGAWIHFSRPAAVRPVASPLGLRLVERDGRLRAEWNANDIRLRQASGAVLLVTDGEPGAEETVQVELPLSHDLLLTGSWPIVRRSGQVRARLRMTVAGEPLEETARFIGRSALQQQGPDVASAMLSRDQARADLERLRQELRESLQNNERILARIAERRQQLARLETPEKTPPRSVEPAKPRPAESPSTALLPPPQPAPAAAASPPPTPALSGQPQRSFETPPRAFPVKPPPLALPPSTSAPPPTPAAGTPPATLYRGPKSGRVIWTGFLNDNAVLRIEGRRPSTGNLSAPLPPAKLRVAAHPAELSSSGLVIYSADPRYARGEVSEAPSAQNAWNRTQIRHDPRRSRNLVLVEGPGPDNNWSRIVLRAQGGSVSVIVLDWEVLP